MMMSSSTKFFCLLVVTLATFASSAFLIPTTSQQHQQQRHVTFLSASTATATTTTIESDTDILGPYVLPKISNPLIEEKREQRTPTTHQRQSRSESWELRIYNDNVNTRDFVARCLVQVTGMTELNAYRIMIQAQNNGFASVGQYNFEIAELYHIGMNSNGITSDLVPVSSSSDSNQ